MYARSHIGGGAVDVVDTLRRALADRYAIERELGAGSMATVYLAQDLRHHRSIALKVLRPSSPPRSVRSGCSARSGWRGGSPIPRSFRSMTRAAGGFLYYVMPYVDGECLREPPARERQLPIPRGAADRA